jgi:hypothetical protein
MFQGKTFVVAEGMKQKTVRAGSRGRWEKNLYHIPIIHTQADMGELGEVIKRTSLQALGRTAWRKKMDTVARMWRTIETFINGLDLDFRTVRLYQDGLPVCGREKDIVETLAGQGSRNYQLLLNLANKGASIMGTESPELLIEEYRLLKKNMLPPQTARFSSENRSGELLQKRDRFIAMRINDTLRSRETGILFLGMLHSLESMLADNIRVISVPSMTRGNR